VKGAVVRPVDGVDLAIAPGETFGLVRRIRLRKSTLGKLILRLLGAHAGTIEFEGANLVPLSQRQLRRYRPGIQMIFQDPYASLISAHDGGTNPGGAVNRPSPRQRKRASRARALAARPRGPAGRRLSRATAEFSAASASESALRRALALAPKLIVCDRAGVRARRLGAAQIINLLDELRARSASPTVHLARPSIVQHLADRMR